MQRFARLRIAASLLAVTGFTGTSDALKMVLDLPLHQQQCPQLDTVSSAGSRWVIHPLSPFRQRWDIMMMLLMAYTLITVPVTVAFYHNGIGLSWFAISCVVDGLFLADVALNFFTGVVLYKGELCAPPFMALRMADASAYLCNIAKVANTTVLLDHGAVARRYLRGWFAIDLISSFPVELVVTLTLGEHYETASYMRTSKALKILRVARFLSLLKLIRVTHAFGLFRRWSSSLRIKTAWLRIAKLLALMLLAAHWSGCLQFAAVQLAGFPPDSWAGLAELQQKSPGDQYTWALFRALSHMLTIGYGTHPPSNTTDAWLTIISMLLGATFYATFIGQISSMVQQADLAGRAYAEKVTVC